MFLILAVWKPLPRTQDILGFKPGLGEGYLFNKVVYLMLFFFSFSSGRVQFLASFALNFWAAGGFGNMGTWLVSLHSPRATVPRLISPP